MLPTAKNQKKRLTNRTGRCTIQLSTNRVTPLCPCHPPVGYSPFYPTTHHHRERYGAPCGRLGEGERAAERLLFLHFRGNICPMPPGKRRGDSREQRGGPDDDTPRGLRFELRRGRDGRASRLTRASRQLPQRGGALGGGFRAGWGGLTVGAAPLLIAGISSAERVPCFSSECRPFAGTGPVPGGGARRAPAGSAAGRRPAAAARHPGPRPAGAYRS